MVKRICLQCEHSTDIPRREGVWRCLVSKTTRTLYSTGKTQTTYKLCDEVNPKGECGKFIPYVGLISYMATWWQSWWDNYYEKRSKKNLHR